MHMRYLKSNNKRTYHGCSYVHCKISGFCSFKLVDLIYFSMCQQLTQGLADVRGQTRCCAGRGPFFEWCGYRKIIQTYPQYPQYPNHCWSEYGMLMFVITCSHSRLKHVFFWRVVGPPQKIRPEPYSGTRPDGSCGSNTTDCHGSVTTFANKRPLRPTKIKPMVVMVMGPKHLHWIDLKSFCASPRSLNTVTVTVCWVSSNSLIFCLTVSCIIMFYDHNVIWACVFFPKPLANAAFANFCRMVQMAISGAEPKEFSFEETNEVPTVTKQSQKLKNVPMGFLEWSPPFFWKKLRTPWFVCFFFF